VAKATEIKMALSNFKKLMRIEGSYFLMAAKTISIIPMMEANRLIMMSL
jgi:hypothetical protein